MVDKARTSDEIFRITESVSAPIMVVLNAFDARIDNAINLARGLSIENPAVLITFTERNGRIFTDFEAHAIGDKDVTVVLADGLISQRIPDGAVPVIVRSPLEVQVCWKKEAE